MSKHRIEQPSFRGIILGLLALHCQLLSALGVSLAWDPSPDTNVIGYALYHGTNSGNYTTRIQVGNQTNAIVQGVTNAVTYYFVATAYTADGLESLPSNEVAYSPGSGTPPVTPAVSITSPSAGPIFTTTNVTVNLSGVASDDLGVTVVRWSNACSQVTGVASGTTSWSANNLALCVGTNRVTITAQDADGNLGSALLTVVRLVPACTASLGLVSWSASATGGTTNLLLNVSGGCAWTASSPCAWLSVSPVSGIGSVTMNLVAASNADTNSRSCQLSIAGQTLTVTQPALGTTILVSPTDLSLAGAAATFCLTVTASAGQPWIATSSSDWLTLTSSGVQSGPGNACFTAEANSNCTPRIGSLTVAGHAIQVVQAGASPRPFGGGTFNGLFASPSAQTNAGFLTLKVTASGAFSGKVTLADGKWGFKGQLDAVRYAAVSIPRTGRSPLNLQLQLETCDLEELSGFVNDGGPTAQLLAYRNVFNSVSNPCPYAGQYTFIGPAATNLPPLGHGYGSMSVGLNGTTKIAGALGDGTKIKMAGWLSPSAAFPVFTSLYRRTGSAYGWLVANDDLSHGNPHGDLIWTKPANSAEHFYPGGFTNTLAVVGSRYRPPVDSSEPMLSFTNGMVYFGGGNLLTDLARAVALLPGNVASVPPSADAASGVMSLKLKVSQGLFSGSINVPPLGRTLKYQGALLQDFNAGYGFITGTNQTGPVIFTSPAN